MLSKQEYDNLEKMLNDCNATYEEVDPKQLRKGATSQAHSQFLKSASTKDLILHNVAIIAKQYIHDRFHVMFDGIAGFVISRNGMKLLESNYYEVERCYHKGHEEFRNMLLRVIGDS